jgi:single-strand DNA-binding protein
MKKLILTGNVGRDPEVKQSNKGEFITFSVAVNNKKDAEWIDCSVFNEKLVGLVKLYVKKGSKLLLEGEPYVNTFTTKDGVNKATMNLIVNMVEFLNKVDSTETATNDSNISNFNIHNIPF